MIRNKLEKLLKNHHPTVNFKFVFSNPYTIKSFFPFKDRIPSLVRSNIVYQFEYPTCKCRYLGETNRNLTLRFAERRGISPRTGPVLTSPFFSAIRDHSLNYDHPISIKNFKILHYASSPTDAKIIESLYIKSTNPSLNNQTISNVLNLCYNTIEHQTKLFSLLSLPLHTSPATTSTQVTNPTHIT